MAIGLESGCRDNGRIDGHILQWVVAEQSVEHCNYKFGGGERWKRGVGRGMKGLCLALDKQAA